MVRRLPGFGVPDEEQEKETDIGSDTKAGT